MTSDLPSESLLSFPCNFSIKVFGKAGDAFELAALTVIRQHAPDLKQNAIQVKPSKKGNYTAMSVTFEATSKKQLDAIYSDLSKEPLVVMAL